MSERFTSSNGYGPVSEALNFLRGIQQSDGAISGFVTSTWAVMAIAAAGEDPNEWTGSSSDSIVNYLITNKHLLDLNNALDVARFILAMTAADENPRNIIGIDYVAALRNLSVNGQIGNEAWLNDDFWGVLALISAGETTTTTVVHESVEFIKAHQNADGGWGWGIVTASDVDDTAAAIMALVSAGEDSSSEVVENALQYLRDNQQSNGGFSSWDVTNTGSDSWAMGAIASVGQHPAQWQVGGTNVVEHLLSLQNENGSFNWTSDDPPEIDKAWYTSYAIVALCLNPYPVNVSSPPITLRGDLNADGIVDIFDIIICAIAFGSYPGHSKWNPFADLDGNEVIDIFDIVIIIVHFGESVI